MVTLGSGDYQYEPVEDWAKLPPGWSFKEIGGVGVDSKDNVYVFNRGEHPMIVFDRDGNFLRSWGEGIFPRAHGVFVAPDETLWLTDDADHTVRQCTLEGKILLTLGTPGKPAPYMSGEPFHRCTHTAMAPERRHLRLRRLRQRQGPQIRPRRAPADVLGRPRHRPRRVQHRRTTSPATPTAGSTSPTAKTTASRYSTATANTKPSGTTCTAPAACSCPAGNARSATSANWVRSQPVNRDVPNLGPRVTIVDNTGKRLSRLGGLRAGLGVDQFLAPHGLCVDSRGDIYVGEVSWTQWPQTVPEGPDAGEPAVAAQIPKSRLASTLLAQLRLGRLTVGPPDLWGRGGSGGLGRQNINSDWRLNPSARFGFTPRLGAHLHRLPDLRS